MKTFFSRRGDCIASVCKVVPTCLSVSPQLQTDIVRFDQRGIPRHLEDACDVRRAVVLPLCRIDQSRLEFRVQLAGMYCRKTNDLKRADEK